MIRRCLTVAAMALVLIVVCQAAMAEQIPSDKVAAFGIPKMSKPPTLDGKVDAEEWKEAVALSGLAQQNPGGNLLIMRPTTYFLAWDDEHLYLACRTWVMPGYKPRVNGRENHKADTFEDAMEFNFRPMGKNVPAGRTDSSYKFTINTLGFGGDYGNCAVGQIFRNWQPDFKTAARQTAQGTGPLGGSWWECEVVMSLKDFNLEGKNQPGDPWKMLLAFNHMPGFFQAALPINSGYFDSSGYPTGTLVEKATTVQMTMDEMPGIKDGVAAVQFKVYNPSDKATSVKIIAKFTEHVALMDEKTKRPSGKFEDTPLLEKEFTETIAPGKTATVKLNEKFPRDLGKNTGVVYFQVAEGDKEIYRYYSFFQLGYPENWTKYQAPKAAFPLSASFNPARNNLVISGDSYYLADPNSAVKMKYSVSADNAAKPVAEGVIDTCRTFYFSKFLELPDLKEANYVVTGSLVTADGKEVGPAAAGFKKLDEAKAFAAWWNNKIGDTERVIKPFTPMTRKDSAVSLWGRTYKLDELGMPMEVTSQGKSILAAPARIVVTIGGKEQVVELKGSPKFTGDKDWRVSFEGSAAGAGLKFKAVGNVEQDGLTYIELTYASEGAAVKVDALRLEFPLSEETSQTLLCTGSGGNYCSRTNILLPAAKQGRLWSTFDTGKPGAKMTVGSFYPQVWVGNEQAGFLWWADCDKGWVPDEDTPAHEVCRSGKEIVLRNNIISKPFDLAAPRTITFSYMASPFRPLVKGWRAAIHSEDGTFNGPHKGDVKNIKPPRLPGTVAWRCLSPASSDPNEWSEMWAEFKKIADEKVAKEQPFNPSRARCGYYVHTSLPLCGYGPNTSDDKVAHYFATDWDRGGFTATQRDYMLWLAQRAFKEGGIRTIYWDIFYCSLFRTAQNGMAYELPDGRLQPGYWGFNIRQFMMRLYALMNDCDLSPGANVCHMTNCLPLVGCGWMDAMMDGEWAEMRDDTPGDWVDQYSEDRMRAFAVPQNFGVQVSWMNLIHIKDKARVASIDRGYKDFIRLHDSWTGQNGFVIPTEILDFGINDERMQYVPYWRNPYVTGDAETKVSAWRMDGRTLLEVFNYSQKDRDVAVTVDLAKLGLSPKAGQKLVVRDLALPGGEAACKVEGNKITVPALRYHAAHFIGLYIQDEATVKAAATALKDCAAELNAATEDWCATAAKATPCGETVKLESGAVQFVACQMGDRIVIAVKNAGTDKKPISAALTLDLAKLNLQPKLPWQQFIGVRTLAAEEKAPAAALDYATGKLTIPNLPAGAVRIIGLRLY